MDTVVRDEKLGRTGFCSLSWSAIIAGALTAFALGSLLNLLNAGLGLVSFPETFRGMQGMAIGGYIWLLICAIVAMFIAGWVAGKIVRYSASPCHGLLHGFLAWSLALLLSVTLAVHVLNAAAEAAVADRAGDHTAASRMLDQADTSNAPNNAADMTTTEQASRSMGGATIGVFFIFLIGAIAASLGGYVGARDGEMTTTGTRKL